ncbi:MAG: hypothetical protein KJ592_01035 [Nanoarchaeota archaeon]|nr:hypothetical protein [Nanoarchaeota archaeon]
MKYKSLELSPPVLGLGAVFFVVLRNIDSVCLNLMDINISVGVLILSVIIQMYNYHR